MVHDNGERGAGVNYEIPLLTIVLISVMPFAFTLGIVAGKTGRPRFVVQSWEGLCDFFKVVLRFVGINVDRMFRGHQR